MVTEMDLSVGKLVKALADKNMLENTVLVFSSDNGGPAAGYFLIA
jgi:arylsulfatase B